MRSMVAILLLLSVMGVLLTPGVEDDVDGTTPISVVQAGNDLCQEVSLIAFGSPTAIGSSSQAETAHIVPSVLRC